MSNYPKQKPGFFGVQRFTLQTGVIGGTNQLGGASPVTANTTTRFYAGMPRTKSKFSGFTFTISTTIPVDNDGVMTVAAYKYDASATTAVALTSAVSMEGQTLRIGVRTAPLSTVSASDLTFEEGDSLEFHVVNDSAAIDTQPAGVVFVGEFLALE